MQLLLIKLSNPFKFLSMALIASSLVLLSHNAVAQNDSLEEIVVIGEKIGSLRFNATSSAGSRLGLSAFETPGSTDLITRADIAIRGDNDTHDTITRSAGLSASSSPGNGGTSISSRGFNGHNSTAITYDGNRLYIVAGTVTFPADTWTLDRVEILRGAGSTVQGIGTLGTTINYIPKAPSFDRSGFEAQIGAGSFGMQRVAFGGGSQINDEWAYRIDAVHSEENGFVDRAEEERDAIAASLLFKPSDDLNIKLSVDYSDVADAPYWGTPLINGEASEEQRRNNYNFEDGSIEYEDLWSRLRVDWKLSDNLSFRNDTYHIKVDREWQNLEEYAFNPETNLIDRAFYLGIIHDQEQIGSRSDFLIDSQLSGMNNRLSVGADLNIIDLDYFSNFATGGFGVADSVPINNFDPGLAPRDSVPTILDYQTDTTQYAVFFDNNLEINDRLSLLVGARYDVIDFDRFDPVVGDNPSTEFDTEFKEFTWRAGLVYQPTESISFYGQASTAVDPVTSPTTINASNQDFEPTFGEQFEVGVKQQFFNGKAEYSLAYFDITKEDIVTQLPGTGVSEQIGQQSSQGFEFTLRANPTESVSVDFNIARISAEYDEFFLGDDSLEGNTPRNVPDTTANLWLTYSPISQLRLGGGVRYVSERFTNDRNVAELPAYSVFDANVFWRMNDSISLTLRGRNLTDEEDYVLSEYTTNQWIFGDPRSYELVFNYSF